MLFVIKFLVFIYFLVLICFCFYECFSVIEEDKFIFMKSIFMNEDGSVFFKFFVFDKRNFILMCSVICVIEVDCIGIDICDGRFCCLWNLIFLFSFLLNNFNLFC